MELKQKSIEEERKEKLQQERIAALDRIFPPPYRLPGKKKIHVSPKYPINEKKVFVTV